MHGLLQDIRFALRMTSRQRGFALVAILTIGLAIGANTAIYSVVNAVLLRPLPYKDPSELVVVWANLTARNRPKFPLSPPDLRDLQEQATTLTDFAGITTFQQTLTSDDGDAARVQVAGVTANYLALLGVNPTLGRGFRADEDDPIGPDVAPQQAPPQVVLISDGLWRQRFGARTDIVGKPLQLNGQNAEIIGVLPPEVTVLFGPGSGLVTNVDVWIPLRIDVAAWPARRNVIWTVVGRMKPGMGVEAARADLGRIAQQWNDDDPQRRTAGYQLDVNLLHDDLTAEVRPILWPLLGAVVFVLLIACANVSNLFLARASAREKEFAVRSALGGTRGQLIRQMLVESGVIAFAGAVLGLLLAHVGTKVVIALRPANLPRLETIGINGNVLLFTLLAAICSALLFGLVPALQAASPRFADSLRDRGHSASRRGQKLFRGGLVVTQVALSVVLVLGAGLMLRSFNALRSVPLGYEPEGLYTFSLNLPGNQYPAERREVFGEELRSRLASLPGAISASAATPLPLVQAQNSGRYGPPEAISDESLYGQADYRFVRRGYFETMRTRLIEGRDFEESDFRDSADVVVVDAKLARLLWPGRSAINERMLVRATTLESQTVRVIGVVEHQRSASLGSEGPETVYFTANYVGGPNAMWWVVRTSGDATAMAAAVRSLIRELDPNLPVADGRTMTDRVDEATTGVRFALVLIAVFGGIALVLAIVGIYGVLSYVVRQRTGEFGVRLALGAQPADVLALVMRQGLTLTGLGILGGVVVGFWATRLLGAMLVDVSPHDPLTFSAVVLAFAATALGACLIPARRATRVSPAESLRAES